MTNSTAPIHLPDFTLVTLFNTRFALPVGVVSLVLTLLLIRPTFLKDDGGAMTFPLRNHLLNVLYQLFFLYPANLAYLQWPHIYQVYINCLVLAQLNCFTILMSISNTFFYAVAVYVQIINPLHVHVWFSPLRSRLAVTLVWAIPAVYACLPSFAHVVSGKNSWIVLSYCYAHILESWYLYTYPIIGLVFLTFLTWVTVNVLQTSRKQANQIVSLKTSAHKESSDETHRMKSRLTKTYLIVVILTGFILMSLLALNVVIVHCETPGCLYTYSTLMVLMCLMDGIILTLVKFRLNPSRLRELRRQICTSR